MSTDPSAYLVVDIGSLFTHVALIDLVADEYRLVARAQTLSTLELPESDAWIGVREAIRLIEQQSARQLTRDDGPMVPQRRDGSGVDGVLFITSAAGILPVVIAAISNDTTGASLLRVARSTYSAVLGAVTLDDERAAPQNRGAEWLDYQLDLLAHLPSSTVLMAGGIEGGNVAPLEHLAHMLGFTVLRRDQAGSREYAHVLFAGNSSAMPIIDEVLSTTAPISTAPNVRPNLKVENLLPARYELIRIYNDKVLPKLPGFSRLRSMTNASIRNTAECFPPMARFLSKQYQRKVLLVDAGSMTTSSFLADGEAMSMAVISNCGSGYGAAGLLDQVEPASISRWLPFDMNDQTVRENILNRLLRPQIIPITREELLFNQALTREALRLSLQSLKDENPHLTYDMVVASGGALVNTAHPAESLLMLLDVLPTQPESASYSTDIYLDRDGLLPLCGTLAWTNPDAALCVLEQDAMRNGPLANWVLVSGDGPLGQLAVEAELMPIGGAPISIPVMNGEIRRIPLASGRRATLRLRLAKGFYIGMSEAGGDVQSEIAAIEGSTLGVVIDARPRPLLKGHAEDERQALMWTWMAQLGAVMTQNPYTTPMSPPMEPAVMAPPPVFVETPMAEAPPPEVVEFARPEEPASQSATPEMPDWMREDAVEPSPELSPEDFGIDPNLPPWLMEPAPDEPATGIVDLGQRERTPGLDLDSLRAELQEEQPKKGWFRRRS